MNLTLLTMNNKTSIRLSPLLLESLRTNPASEEWQLYTV